jgi:hypothetical protein
MKRKEEQTMKKVFFLLTAALAIIMLSNCAFMSRVNMMMPDKDYNPFRIDDLRSDEPLIIKGPFIDGTVMPPQAVYIVTPGYVRLHKELWQKEYPESKDAEGVTRSRLLVEYQDYEAEYKGDYVIFRTAFKVRTALVEFVESVQGKK